MKTQKLISLGLCASLSLMLFSGCTGTPVDGDTAGEQTAASVPVETSPASIGSINATTTLSGKINASREIMVMPPIPGEVASISVEVGDTVRADQVLFTMDKNDINEQYQPLLDNYNRTMLLGTESLKLAQQNVDNTQALFEIGAASQLQLDQAKLQLLQQQTTNDSQISQLETSMDDIEEMLTDQTVKSPIAGVVTTVNIVEKTMAANTSPAIIVSETHLPEIHVDIPETMLTSIKTGNAVKVTIPSASNLTIDAVIQSITPVTDERTQMYTVKITLPQSDDYSVGMFCNVTFVTQTANDTILIPSDSVITEGEARFVYVLEGNTAKRVDVTTGIADATLTQILTGLDGSETIITKGQTYVADGTLVEVVTDAPEDTDQTVQNEEAPSDDTSAGAEEAGEE